MSTDALISHVLALLPDSQHSQALWSGCGHIYKFTYQNEALVAKVAAVPEQLTHRHITQSQHSLRRKYRSYRKELNFYRQTARHYVHACSLPEVKALAQQDDVFICVFTDFESQGYHNVSRADSEQVELMLKWLARFHAVGLVSAALTEMDLQGNYWHLNTRPDEYARMASGQLKQYASEIDHQLNTCAFQTCIHGDAKLANFAFSGKEALGYDFQHIGKGIGISDVMLLLTSLYSDPQLEMHAQTCLDRYFEFLTKALSTHWPETKIKALEQSWRLLWPFVWADFQRFLLGWKPDHQKLTSYMLRQSELCLKQLGESSC
ncbi:ecdysteroid 22-kinase family protein [Pseudoalteromonas sp. DL2-H2.2]|uniref:ecdysteroid 22-kinase family protein n=1 Tax=Pseudoalteromonas sp. DL2-H2.2 TaxID=2908889 RepID=UPI001F175686|nr:ecdysteroid 22-kinase family protein [Pseudoalteromonas sp. DL2-H2.2]MCF2906813.1 ecdysteroid 22-kinase family protein [Pseudoalteromonas sp. DL2-H2.2]